MIMDEYIKVPLEEALRVFVFLEKVHVLMHQPMHVKDLQYVENFAKENYPEIHALYYNIVWHWLPERAQHDIIER